MHSRNLLSYLYPSHRYGGGGGSSPLWAPGSVNMKLPPVMICSRHTSHFHPHWSFPVILTYNLSAGSSCNPRQSSLIPTALSQKWHLCPSKRSTLVVWSLWPCFYHPSEITALHCRQTSSSSCSVLRALVYRHSSYAHSPEKVSSIMPSYRSLLVCVHTFEVGLF